ncbi:hypothetical protein OIU84_006537 [Salix udensis]|uniref:Uncharacterized protein n=1 Tax=Salix udensis TaxID=889485 RepID=A0AAD6JYM1_9ROSI|nr:hypothetical protein OIU84_006537 [Salix udensis]
MELEPSVPRGTAPAAQAMPSKNTKTKTILARDSPSFTATHITSSSSSKKDLCRSSKSFRALDTGVPKSTSADKKLAWLRSQIIGGGVEFDSPFGKKKTHLCRSHCLRKISSLYREFYHRQRPPFLR